MNSSIYLWSIVGLLVSCRAGKYGPIDADTGGETAVEDDGSDSESNETGSPATDSGESPDDSGAPDGLPVVDIPREGMLNHLNALMTIATENGGNRAAGSTGYAASVEYVKGQLEAAGYTVQASDFDIEKDVWNADPYVGAVGAEVEWVYGEDFYAMSEMGSGTVTAPITGVDLMIPPPDEEGVVTSGCEAEDFEGFPAGHVALIQRGACTFQEKTTNAVSAGAVAVLIFNEGQPGRRDLFGGTLDAEAENTIPVFTLSYAVGEALAALPADAEVNVVADFERLIIPTQNLFADTSGDAKRVVVVGAHLDSVEAGPGINDNGSGVALILESALQMASAGVEPDNKIRYAFWGGEELGLLGSMDYVFDMSESEHADIMANLNFDMVASPNPVRMVYDGDGSRFGQPGPPGSDGIEGVFSSWFEANGQAYRETPFDGRSDYGPFIWTGIPAGGLFTGAEQVMSGPEADLFGGESGLAYDACYHKNCDTIDNLDLDVLDEMAAAASDAIIQLGFFSGSVGEAWPSAAPAPLSRARALPDWIPSACASHERIWRR